MKSFWCAFCDSQYDTEEQAENCGCAEARYERGVGYAEEDADWKRKESHR